MSDEWSTLYVRVLSTTHKRIVEAAKTDDRTVAKWIDRHFRDYFAELDQQCQQTTSSPNSSPALPPSQL
jgi:anti-sigma-K factor RskA